MGVFGSVAAGFTVEAERSCSRRVDAAGLRCYAYVGVTSRDLGSTTLDDFDVSICGGGASAGQALSAFRRAHAMNDVFTQVRGGARDAPGAPGARGKLTPGCAERPRGCRWILRPSYAGTAPFPAADPAVDNKPANAEDPDENGECKCRSARVAATVGTIPRRLQRLRKSGLRQISRTDPESRFLRSRDGWQLGYTAEVAVSEDHLIVAQRVTQNASDNASLLPLVHEASRQCRGKPQRVSADTGFFSLQNLHRLREREIDGYVPDANLSYELKGKGRAQGIGRSRHLRDPAHRQMRQKLRDPASRTVYAQRKAIVEPVFGAGNKNGAAVPVAFGMADSRGSGTNH